MSSKKDPNKLEVLDTDFVGLYFKKDGLYLKYLKKNYKPKFVKIRSNSNRKYSKQTQMTLCRHFLKEVREIDEDVTLKDFLTMIKPIVDFYSFCPEVTVMRPETVAEFYKELNSRKKPNVNMDVDYTCLSWDIHIECGHLCKFGDFYGCGEKNDQRYAVSFSPLYDYAHLPFKIKNDLPFKIKKMSKFKVYPVGGFRDNYNEVYLKQDFTLSELIFAVLYEISFYGGPKKREEFNKELDQICQDVKSGKEKIFSSEEVYKDLDLEDDD